MLCSLGRQFCDGVIEKTTKRDKKQQHKRKSFRRLRSISAQLNERNVKARIRKAVGNDKVASFTHFKPLTSPCTRLPYPFSTALVACDVLLPRSFERFDCQVEWANWIEISQRLNIFVNVILEGKVPHESRLHFSDASFIALKKPVGGFRTIVARM